MNDQKNSTHKQGNITNFQLNKKQNSYSFYNNNFNLNSHINYKLKPSRVYLYCPYNQSYTKFQNYNINYLLELIKQNQLENYFIVQVDNDNCLYEEILKILFNNESQIINKMFDLKLDYSFSPFQDSLFFNMSILTDFFYDQVEKYLIQIFFHNHGIFIINKDSCENIHKIFMEKFIFYYVENSEFFEKALKDKNNTNKETNILINDVKLKNIMTKFQEIGKSHKKCEFRNSSKLNFSKEKGLKYRENSNERKSYVYNSNKLLKSEYIMREKDENFKNKKESEFCSDLFDLETKKNKKKFLSIYYKDTNEDVENIEKVNDFNCEVKEKKKNLIEFDGFLQEKELKNKKKFNLENNLKNKKINKLTLFEKFNSNHQLIERNNEKENEKGNLEYFEEINIPEIFEDLNLKTEININKDQINNEADNFLIYQIREFTETKNNEELQKKNSEDIIKVNKENKTEKYFKSKNNSLPNNNINYLRRFSCNNVFTKKFGESPNTNFEILNKIESPEEISYLKSTVLNKSAQNFVYVNNSEELELRNMQNEEGSTFNENEINPPYSKNNLKKNFINSNNINKNHFESNFQNNIFENIITENIKTQEIIPSKIKKINKRINFSTDELIYHLFIFSLEKLEEFTESLVKETDSLKGIYLELSEKERKDFFIRIHSLEVSMHIIFQETKIKKKFFKFAKNQFKIFNKLSNDFYFKNNFNFFLELMVSKITQIELTFETLENFLKMIKENYHIIIEDNTEKANVKLNHVIKVLTVLTTIYAPMNIIPGLFGMNVKVPFVGSEVDNLQPFFFICFSLLILLIVQMYIFRKLKWF